MKPSAYIIILVVALLGSSCSWLGDKYAEWLWSQETKEELIEHEISDTKKLRVVLIDRMEHDTISVSYVDKNKGVSEEEEFVWMGYDASVGFQQAGDIFRIYKAQTDSSKETVVFINSASNTFLSRRVLTMAELAKRNKDFLKQLGQQSVSADSATAEPAGP